MSSTLSLTHVAAVPTTKPFGSPTQILRLRLRMTREGVRLRMTLEGRSGMAGACALDLG